MPVIDWSATAAWTAVIISITGTVVGPLITAIITNKHQLKLREMDIKQCTVEQRENIRLTTITAFISNIGKCLAIPDDDNIAAVGQVFHTVYQYVPNELWPSLDNLYISIYNCHINEAKSAWPSIVHTLSELLKDTPKTTP